MSINQPGCYFCGYEALEVFSHYETRQNGTRSLFRCTHCRCIFSETKGTFLEGLRKPVSVIAQVLKSRSEGGVSMQRVGCLVLPKIRYWRGSIVLPI